MNYKSEMDILLKENLTETAFEFWIAINKKISPVWDRLSSSSKKYHTRKDGTVQTIAEHTYEMLYACVKIWSLFDVKPQTSNGDILLLAISLHDSFKYGEKPEERKHTTGKHDKIAADKIKSISNFIGTFLTENETCLLEESVRFHSGRWSTDAEMDFDFSNYHPFVAFVHFLDMMSTKDLIKI